MNATIIFGTKKLGQTAAAASSEKYPNQAVITVEGQKGAKKSRRILLNTKAAALLNAEVGSVQNLVFASVEMGAETPNQVLIANADIMDAEVDVTYKTSKNKVSFGEDTSEKGKAITSSHACSEIFKFLGLDDSTNVEFELNAFDSDEIEAFSLDAGFTEATTETTMEEVNSIETNTGTMNTEEVVESVREEVAQAETLDPITFETETFETETVEETTIPLVDSEWNN